MTRKILLTLCVVLLFAATSGSTQAALQLRIEDVSAGSGVILTDSDGDGVLFYSGSIGQFSINMTTAISKPVLGGGHNYAEMDLNDVTVNSSGAGTLRIIVADTDFIGGPDATRLGFITAFGGTLSGGGTVDARSWLNPQNDGLALGTPGSYGAGTMPSVNVDLRSGDVAGMDESFGVGGFSGNDSVDFIKNGSYAMFGMVTVNFTKSGVVSYDLNLQTVPEPSAIGIWALFAIGGAGAVIVRGKWSSRKQS